MKISTSFYLEKSILTIVMPPPPEKWIPLGQNGGRRRRIKKKSNGLLSLGASWTPDKHVLIIKRMPYLMVSQIIIHPHSPPP